LFVPGLAWQMYAASGVYEYVNTSGPAPTKTLAEMVTALKVSVPPRDLNHADARVQLQSVLRSWLSLPNAVLGMVVDHLPSPLAATPNRYGAWPFLHVSLVPPLYMYITPWSAHGFWWLVDNERTSIARTVASGSDMTFAKTTASLEVVGISHIHQRCTRPQN
jgi:hypothetical protein